MAITLLMIGGRTPAIEAAIKLGCQVYLIADLKTPKRLLKKCVAGTLISLPSTQQAVIQAAQSLFPIEPPDTVISVTEQAILPAAWCRQYWRLSGLQPDDAKAALIKSLMKQRFIHHQIPCWPTYAVDSVEQGCKIAETLQFPLVVKALASSGSRGFRVIHNRARLRRVVKAMLDVAAYGGVGIEKLVEAKEFSVEVIVKNRNIRFTNFTYYQVPGAMNIVPANFSDNFKKRALALAKKILKAFNFECGMAHIEFYFQNDQLWAGEINARPPGGGLMELISLAYDFDAWQATIASQLSAQTFSINQVAKSVAANWMIHPGAGTVNAIDGQSQIAQHPFTHEFKLNLKIGQIVNKRAGTGETVGQYTLLADNYQQAQQTLNWAQQTLQIALTESR